MYRRCLCGITTTNEDGECNRCKLEKRCGCDVCLINQRRIKEQDR